MTGLVSGEGVSIELSRAGLGSRIIAAIIDLAAQLAAFTAAAIIDGLIGASDPDIGAALLLLELVLILAVYPIVSEWLTHGKTLGKLAMGLRVVRDDGGPIGFRQALTRGLAGFFLEKPGIAFPPLCTAAGMITLGASKSSKRIGDMMAGTFVVNERAGHDLALARVPLFVPPALYGWAQSLDLAGLDDQLALQLRQFVLRAAQMTPAAQDVLGAQFRARILAVTSPPPPVGVPTAVLLVTVLAERRRRAESAFGLSRVGPQFGGPPWGPAPNQNAGHPLHQPQAPVSTPTAGPFTAPK